WVALRRAGPALHGVAWPDTIELNATCHKRDLSNCLTSFVRALSARETDPATLHELQQRLIETRHQNLARDPARTADALSLRALLGDDAAGMLPLGRAQDDADAKPATVQSFLAGHF